MNMNVNVISPDKVSASARRRYETQVCHTFSVLFLVRCHNSVLAVGLALLTLTQFTQITLIFSYFFPMVCTSRLSQ